MNFETTNRRLAKLEVRHVIGHRGAIRIITEDDADAGRQIAYLVATGTYTAGMVIIDRRLVDPSPRSAH